MKNYLITLIDKEGNQKKIGCQSENINTAVGYATSQMQMPFTVVSVEELESKDKFTEIERLILENTPKRFRYIVRHRNWDLVICRRKPRKYKPYCEQDFWDSRYDYSKDEHIDFDIFNHLFQSIKWEDEEPYKFR